MSFHLFVPEDFDVPARVETAGFTVVPLTMDRFAIDYECYTSSVEHIKASYSIDEGMYVGPGLVWPEGVTIRMALLDAASCEMAFYHLRSQFAFQVLNPAETRQLGCVYLFPTTRRGYDAEARMWVRRDEFERGFDSQLYSWFRDWVATAWPFRNVAWPGREITWSDWLSLPLKER